jgi:hypothetical protein
MFPVLVGAGVQPAWDWVRRGRTRPVLLGAAFALGLGCIVIVLPVIPARALHSTPITDLNYDAGETVGWPAYVREIAAAAPPDAVVVTGNYGEAGAVARYGPDLGLTKVFSGHNGWWWWGPPDVPQSRPVVAVGLSRDLLDRTCRSVQLVRRLDNGVELDNDEQGEPVWLCRGLRAPWKAVWGDFKAVG